MKTAMLENVATNFFVGKLFGQVKPLEKELNKVLTAYDASDFTGIARAAVKAGWHATLASGLTAAALVSPTAPATAMAVNKVVAVMLKPLASAIMAVPSALAAVAGAAVGCGQAAGPKAGADRAYQWSHEALTNLCAKVGNIFAAASLAVGSVLGVMLGAIAFTVTTVVVLPLGATLAAVASTVLLMHSALLMGAVFTPDLQLSAATQLSAIKAGLAPTASTL